MATTKLTLRQVLDVGTATFVRGKWGQRWVAALGEHANYLSLWAKDGVKSRFVLLASPDGVTLIGNERKIERAPSESDADYQLRVWGAWETWVWSGTAIGIYRGLESLGWQVSVHITDPYGSWPTGWPADGHVWLLNATDILGTCPDGDNDPTHWARFWTFLDAYAEGIRVTSMVIGDGTVIGSAGTAIGITATPDEVSRWKRVVRKWKGSHSTCPAMYLVLSDGGWGDIIGPFSTIGGGATIGGITAVVPVGEA